MIRKFAVALFAVSTLSSSIAMALGLGEARVNSALNQPLEAEIELVSVRDLGAAEILPALASNSDFSKAGVERVQFLSDLKFKVVFKDSNKAVIRLTSNRPVREPFLNFLVEVVWPNGRLLREYALLIDPPMFTSSRPGAVAPARTQAAPSQAPATPRTIASAPASRVAAPAGRAPSASRSASGTYGPTSGSDTLWAIANQHRPNSSVTTQQTMLAIQDLNPDAFINDNINLLKAGQVLRLPEETDVQKRSVEDAVSQVRAQNRAFAEKQTLGRKQLDSNRDQAGSSTAQKAPTGDELKIVAADKDLSGETPRPGQPTGGKAGKVTGTGGGAEAELAVALENLDKTTRDNQELQGRLKDLESQLDTLQRLVSLKDDQLAALQGQSAKNAQAENAQAETPQVEGTATPSEQAPAQTTPTENAAASVPPDSDAPATQGVSPADTSPADAVAPSETTVVTPAVNEPAATVSKPEPAAPAPVAEPGIFEQILANPMYLAIAGGSGILLLLILLWLVSRHNASKEQEFHHKLAAAGSTPDEDDDVLDLGDNDTVIGTPAAAGAAAAVVARQADGESEDVLAEADIYLAYGRLDQAARLLEDNLDETPERVDVRLKLLEVYAQGGNVGAFEQHFAALQSSGDDHAIQKAEQLRADMPESTFEEQETGLSLDDLENQLLTGKSTFGARPDESHEEENEFVLDSHEGTSKDRWASATASDDQTVVHENKYSLENEEDHGLNEEFLALDNTADSRDTADADSDELQALGSEADSLGMSEEPEADNLDIEFDISDLDLDSLEEKNRDTRSVALTDLESIDFDSGDSAESSLAPDEEDLMQTDLARGLDTEQDLDADNEILESELELDNLDLDVAPEKAAFDESELADLDDLEAEASLDSAGEEIDELSLEESLAAEEPFTELDSQIDDIGLPEASDEDLSPTDFDLESVPETLEPAAEIDEESMAVLSDEEIAELEDAAAEADLSELSSAEGEPEPELDEEDFDFLAGTDEAATKLDLARAYIDMGDSEGARDILEEVAQEGSEQQRQDAVALIKTLE